MQWPLCNSYTGEIARISFRQRASCAASLALSVCEDLCEDLCEDRGSEASVWAEDPSACKKRSPTVSGRLAGRPLTPVERQLPQRGLSQEVLSSVEVLTLTRGPHTPLTGAMDRAAQMLLPEALVLGLTGPVPVAHIREARHCSRSHSLLRWRPTF